MAGDGFRAIEHPKWWSQFLLGGASALLGYYVLQTFGAPPLILDLVAMLFPVAATVAIVVGVVMHRPASRTPWYLLAAAQGANLVGDLIGTIYRNVFHTDPYPSVGDVAYLVAYPLQVIALVMFVRRRTPDANSPALLDASMLSLALGLVWWLYVIRPLTLGHGTVAERAVSVAYPIMDVLVLTVALRLAVGVGARTRAFWLLVGSFVAVLLGDMIYGMLTARDLYDRYAPWVDWTFLVAYVLVGAAALHPSMPSLDRRAAVVVRGATRSRLVLLTVAGLFPLLLLVMRDAVGGRSGLGVPEIAAASAALFVLMVVRMNGLGGVRERLAIHDGLTGAYSRRFLDETFRAECARARSARTDLAFLLVDVDNFVLINEMYGNVSGDLMLAEIAARLHRELRPGDLVARERADRFMVLLPAIDGREALLAAERLRAVVSADRIEVGDGGSVRVTASVGLAMLSRDGDTPQALMRAADQALYVAKRAGRNRAYTTYGPVNVPAYS